MPFRDHGISPVSYCHPHACLSGGEYRKRTECCTPGTTLSKETKKRMMALSLSREEDRYVLVILCVEQNKEKRHLLLTNWSEMSFLCESEERERGSAVWRGLSY